MGDRNTTYFHKYASYKRSVDRVRGFEDDLEVLVIEENKMTTLACSYFKTSFTSNEVRDMTNVLSRVGNCIAEEMNWNLLAP